jgi:hypothetical protein
VHNALRGRHADCRAVFVASMIDAGLQAIPIPGGGMQPIWIGGCERGRRFAVLSVKRGFRWQDYCTQARP